jgi:hypothetical protein
MIPLAVFQINEQYSKLLEYSAQNCKRLFNQHPDDLAEDLSNLEKKEGTEYSMEKRYIASRENYLD